jgi:group I intron endonuclease
VINNKAGIYRISSPSGKCYIGQSVDVSRRIYEHKNNLSNGRHDNQMLQRAFGKYGRDGLVFEQIFCVFSPDDLTEFEQYFMDTENSEYNICPAAGSTRGLKLSAETRAKMSAALTGKQRSADHSAKLSAALKGKLPSAETRAKLSAARKGKQLSADHIAKLSAALKGKRHSEETRAKISAAKKGKMPSSETRAKIGAAHKGRVQSAETRAKLSASRKGIQPSAETRAKRSSFPVSVNGVKYLSTCAATRALGINDSRSHRIRERLKLSGLYVFEHNGTAYKFAVI